MQHIDMIIEYGNNGAFFPSLYMKPITYPIEPFTNPRVILIFHNNITFDFFDK
jgi:hypothetical protein